MKITPKILSIPPYLSTSWDNVSSLRVHPTQNGLLLTIQLKDGSQAEVPGLNQEALTAIFNAHAQFIEGATPQLNPFGFRLPLKGDVATFDLSPMPLQHNEAQANFPPLSPNVLKKIAILLKSFGVENTESLPKAEPNCQCIYCQVMNAIAGVASPEEETISAEDLTFRDWEVTQAGDQIYTVTSPLDTNEHYSVFLGNPIGCTCGQKNCEHIRAVLKT